MPSRILDTPIAFLKGVGPQKGELLEKELGIATFADLLQWFPFRYIDRSRFYKIRDIRSIDGMIQVKGIISKPALIAGGKARRLVATLRDETGSLDLVWFKGIRWVSDMVQANTEYVVFGKPNTFRGKVNMPHPEMEPAASFQALKAHFQPVYSTTEKLRAKGLDSKGIYRLMQTLLKQVPPQEIHEILPAGIREPNKLMVRHEAVRQVHLPSSTAKLEQARRRLKIEELLLTQLRIVRLRQFRIEHVTGFEFPELGRYFNGFYHDVLGFELTNAQKRVLKDVRRDLRAGTQMNRLLQGDVGSGKTIVAVMSALMALDNGFQACIMAPTEILAQQHFKGISELLKPLGVKVGLLTGSVKGRDRKQLMLALETGNVHIAIGTHALIEDKVQFHNLGLVVIDEQHRFGVAQRASMWKKSDCPPHVLVMTATPIPRTLAMTVYGDLDISVIDELPPGRKPITTRHATDQQRLKVFGFMEQEIAKGRQVYVVYPLINESEKLDYKDLMDGHESIVRRFPLPKYAVSILHGQMKNEDKQFEMDRFARGETQILVSTTVIEVGVNVPNASVMVIESAERFGLAQLHQLRGRVGRGSEQSYCILMTGNKLSDDARLRMQTMVDSNDGFRIAEVDMELRGPGDIEGTRQSGQMDFRIANLATDQELISLSRRMAEDILQIDPELRGPDWRRLREALAPSEADIEWSQIS